MFRNQPQFRKKSCSTREIQSFLVLQPEDWEAPNKAELLRDGNISPLSRWKAIAQCDQNSSQLWYWNLFPSPREGSLQSFILFIFYVFSVMVMNIMILYTHSSEQCCKNIRKAGYETISKHFALFMEKCLKY